MVLFGTCQQSTLTRLCRRYVGKTRRPLEKYPVMMAFQSFNIHSLSGEHRSRRPEPGGFPGIRNCMKVCTLLVSGHWPTRAAARAPKVGCALFMRGPRCSNLRSVARYDRETVSWQLELPPRLDRILPQCTPDCRVEPEHESAADKTDLNLQENNTQEPSKTGMKKTGPPSSRGDRCSTAPRSRRLMSPLYLPG